MGEPKHAIELVAEQKHAIEEQDSMLDQIIGGE
jgi:hypothetical protein